MIGAFLNDGGELSSVPIPPLFLFLSFSVPIFICFSKWSNKKIWKKQPKL
jgi:hypothetical protein